ncbi:MAG: tetratricopeptide repeat protein [Mesorhizobium sp.]|nr:MAG: tetratricopeptide repeat protein [Mesorhizobium sp.]
MSRRTGAFTRAFVAWLSFGPLLAPAGIVVTLGGLRSPALAESKDYATCFSDGALSADQQISVCTPIAEDSAEIPDLRVNAYFWRGLAYTQKNDIDRVIADMTDVLALDPTYVPAFTNRAIAWESKADFERAVADYTRAIALTPDDANLYADRARALNKKGEHDRAIVECDKAIDIDPANEMAYGVRGVAWEDKGDATRAQADYDKAESVRADPITPYHDRALSWIAKGERRRAEADCKHIAGVDADKGRDCSRRIAEAFGEPRDGGGEKTATAQNAVGIEWQEKGDHTRAIAAFDEAIRLNPASSAFYFNRAKSWGLKKNYARAIADLDEAVRRDPANAPAYRVRGMTMARVGNSKEALADLDKAISISSDDPKSYFERALVWEASDPDKAIADLDKAIALDPANADYRKERLSVQIGKRRAEGQPVLQSPGATTSQAHVPIPAEPQAAKPIAPPTYEPPQLYAKRDNSAAIDWNMKSGLQQMQVDPKGAIDTFSFVIGLDPYNADAYYHRSIAEALLGNFDLAVGDCRRAVELDPKRAGTCREHLPGEQGKPTAAKPGRDPATARILLERAQMRLSKHGVDGALLDFDKAISLDPENADAYFGRSRARMLKGDQAGAAVDCRRAIELDLKRTGSCDEQAAVGENRPAPPVGMQQLQPSVAAAVETLAKQLGQGKASPTRILSASKMLEAAEATDPRVLSAVQSGDTFSDAGKYDHAIAEYEKAIALDPSSPFAYFGRGKALAAKRAYDLAIADYDRVIQLVPDLVSAHIRRRMAKTMSGDVEGALADCGHAATLDPKARDAFFCKGMAWHAKGDGGRAITAYSLAIAIDPKDAASYYGRGMARADRKDYDGAIADFDRAIDLDPHNPDYLVSRKAADAARGKGDVAAEAGGPDPKKLKAFIDLGDALYKRHKFDRAIAEYNKAITLDPKMASAYLGRGMSLVAKGKYDAAIDDYGKVIELYPAYVEAYLGRAVAWSKKNELDRAIADFSRAAKIDPSSAPIYFGRGSAWLANGDYDQAIADYDQALRLDPRLALAEEGRKLAVAAKRKSAGSEPVGSDQSKLKTIVDHGYVWYKKRKYARATTAFEQAIALDPKNPAGYRGRAMVRTDTHDYDGAIADFSKVIELAPKSSDAYFGRAALWGKKNELDRALADYDRGLDIDQSWSMAYYGRATKRLEKADYEGAMTDFDKAIELDPKVARFYIDRGFAYAAKKDIDSATRDFNKAISLDRKKSAGAHFGLGAIKESQGDHDGAIAEYSRSIEIDPTYADAYDLRAHSWRAKGDLKRAEADRKKALSLGLN